MLRRLRRSQLINQFVRKLLLISEKTTIKISNRWRVCGNINIQIGDITFSMYSNCDDPIVDCLFYNRNYQETSDLLLFTQLAKQAKNILDIGAFTGLYSLASTMANRNCHVFSFEPNPINFKRLTFNKEINQFQNMNCFPLAIGAESMMIDFFCSTNQGISDTSSANLDFSQASYGGSMNWEAQKIQQVSIDDFVQKEQLSTIDLIKIDAEHYELNVFRGMLLTVKESKPIILCEIFLDNERKEFFNSFVTSHNYFVYAIIKEGIIRLETGILPNHDGLNFLFASGKTNQVYTSFKEMNLLVAQLLNKN